MWRRAIREQHEAVGRTAAIVFTSALFATAASARQGTRGELLDPATHGPIVIESLDVVAARERAQPPAAQVVVGARPRRPGEWIVPSRRAMRAVRSGERCAVNQFGDPRMGIGFGTPVDVEGAWIAAAGSEGASARALQAVGYRAGREVARTRWFETIVETPTWCELALRAVDRIELVALPAVDGAGWYGLDDLTFVRASGAEPHGSRVVVDFEDLAFGARLTDSGYRGLIWERGRGDFTQSIGPPPAPHVPHAAAEDTPAGGGDADVALAPLGVPPAIVQSFRGPQQGDLGAPYPPPDSCAAVGLEHIVTAVNHSLSVYSKSTGQRLFEGSLNAFFQLPFGGGDPRVVFDPHSRRFILTTTDFGTRMYLAVTLSPDPLGAWVKTSILVSQGTDALRRPDYPTLGVDAHGVYVTAQMVGGSVPRMSIFAIDKTPLLAVVPSLGAVTAWRNLPYEDAIQPCATYGLAVGEYCVSRRSTTQLRLRLVLPPLDAPTLLEVGSIGVPAQGHPPDAPTLGSAVRLDTIDARPMNAIFRNGSIWIAHTIAHDNRSAVRWYELDPNALTVRQIGTVADTTRWYYFGTLAVNANGDVALGFSASSPTEYASAYVAGRRASDPPSATSLPIALKAGEGPYVQLDGLGRNRWGDYSATAVDPVDDFTIWSIQEYARADNQWGTWIAKLAPGCPGLPDCNANGVADPCEVAGALAFDHNGSGVLDECEGFDGAPFCFGDGTLGVPCPCAPPDDVPSPPGGADAGCASSWSAAGARLSVSGTTAPDTLAFRAEFGARYVGFAYLLKGDGQSASGVRFGDGVRCVEGALLAFGAHAAATNGAPAGEWTYPNAVQTTAVGAATGQSSGATAFYQLVYRNAQAGFCSPATFNTSNAFRVAW